jgi:uncharacterized protein (DUF1778 family)
VANLRTRRYNFKVLGDSSSSEVAMASTPQNARLDVRMSDDSKRLIEQAAGLLGLSVSSFTVSTMVRESQEVVERFGMLRLSDRDRDIFLAALDNPPEPNEKLRAAAERHAREIQQ